MRIFWIILGLFSLLLAGDEILINSDPEKNHRDPDIAGDGHGHVVLVWTRQDSVSGTTQGNICLQRLNSMAEKAGPEIRVNRKPQGDQENPAVAMNASGNAVVVWSSYSDPDSMYDIKGQLLKNGDLIGGNFVINSHIAHSQSSPSVDMNDEGDFVVVWDSWLQDGGDRGVYGQRFNAEGDRVGKEFQVNHTTAFSQARPRVRYTVNGQFVVIWESWKQERATPSGYGVYGRLFDANGAKHPSEFRINSYAQDHQWQGDLCTFDDGGFAVVWCSWEQDGDDGGIYLQRFDALAQKTGPEIPVNQTTRFYQWLPRISRLASGDMAVVWSSWKQDGSREGVYARLYDRNGQAKSPEKQINLYTANFQWEPALVPTGTEELFIVWSSWAQFSDNYDVLGRKLLIHTLTTN